MIKVHIDRDVQGYRPEKGKLDRYGNEVDDRLYDQKDFDRLLVLDTRTELRKATNHFADPAFDGPVLQVYEPGPDDPVAPPDDVAPPLDNEDPVPPEPSEDEVVVVEPERPDIAIRTDGGRPRKVYVDDVPVSIVADRVEYLDENGRLITESLRDFTRKAVTRHFASLDAFLSRWRAAERKQAVLDELEAEGLPLGSLAEEVGKDLDPFDLICHVAFDQPPLTRRERADNVRKRDVFTRYGAQARAVLEALLQKYQDQGVTDLDDPRILQISPFDSMGTTVQLLKEFGGRPGFEKAVHELQTALYESAA